MYQIFNKSLPLPLLTPFQHHTQTHNYNTRRRDDPPIIPRQYAAIDRSFLCRGPALWSILGGDLKHAKSVKSMSNRLKKSHFLKY